MSKLSDEEKSLFASAMQGVSRLNESKTVENSHKTQRYQKTMKVLRDKNREHTRQMDEHPTLEHYKKIASVSSHEFLIYHRKGIKLQDLTRLKRGEMPIEAELDLHGLTEVAADETLQRFINRCYQHNKRCVLVIHGKGYNSEASEPVLKNLVNMRLQQVKKVIAYCSSLPKDGGTGSVYVWLKGQ